MAINQLKKIPTKPAIKLFVADKRAIKQTTKHISTSIYHGRNDSSIELRIAMMNIVMTIFFMEYHLDDEQNLIDNIYP